jgi:acyl carrier protein
MMKDDVLERLQGIFREVFDDSALEITRSTDASQIDGWDSFMHINLIVAIEETFVITFTTQEIGQFTCVGDVVDLLTTKSV